MARVPKNVIRYVGIEVRDCRDFLGARENLARSWGATKLMTRRHSSYFFLPHDLKTQLEVKIIRQVTVEDLKLLPKHCVRLARIQALLPTSTTPTAQWGLPPAS